MRSVMKPWLLAACAAAGVGCGSDSTQVVIGKVTASNAVAVRAVADSEVITAGRVRTDGSFTLALPAGKGYRLEVLTATGVLPIMSAGGSTALSFDVCHPSDPWDLGGIGAGSGGGPGGTACPPPPPPPPPPCDPATDPDCKLPPPPPPPPPPCDPATDPGCTCPPPPPPPPPPCDPTTDPGCTPPPPPCDPATDASCPLPPPPCTDPTDPTTCKDPCMTDPSQCGCGSGSAWPPPCDPADPSCKPPGGMVPANPPGDFGCTGGGTT